MVVTKEEYCRAMGKLLLQETLNIGDYAACFIPTIQGVTHLQEALEHIYN